MFSNDILGASQAWDGTKPDPHMQSVGGENDGATHQLARFVTKAVPFELLPDMNVRVIWRRDRYLRGSDHISFQQQGTRRPRAPRQPGGQRAQVGDRIEVLDFDHIARCHRHVGQHR
jgi:hypothetical protein